MAVNEGAYARVELGERAKRFQSGEAKSIYDNARRLAVAEGAFYLWPQMVRRAPRGATGLLASSIMPDLQPNGLAMGDHAFVGPSGPAALYAYYADQGRRPGGFPPLAAIAYWARRKGINIPPFLIARKIAMKGTKGSEFVRRTAEEAGPGAQRVMAGRLLSEVKDI